MFVFFFFLFQCSVFQKWKDFEGWSSQVNVNSLFFIPTFFDYTFTSSFSFSSIIVGAPFVYFFLEKSCHAESLLNFCRIFGYFIVQPLSADYDYCKEPSRQGRFRFCLVFHSPDTLPWFGQLFSTLARLLFHAGPPAHLHIFHCTLSQLKLMLVDSSASLRFLEFPLTLTLVLNLIFAPWLCFLSLALMQTESALPSPFLFWLFCVFV